MAVNKVEINGAIVLDLTQDTVSPTNLLKGMTAHNASGEIITGTQSALPTTTFKVGNFTMSEGVATFTILSNVDNSTNLNLDAFLLYLGTETGEYVFPAIMYSLSESQKTYIAANIGSSGFASSLSYLVQNTETNVYTWELVSTSGFEDQNLYNGNLEFAPVVYSLQNS